MNRLFEPPHDCQLFWVVLGLEPTWLEWYTLLNVWKSVQKQRGDASEQEIEELKESYMISLQTLSELIEDIRWLLFCRKIPHCCIEIPYCCFEEFWPKSLYIFVLFRYKCFNPHAKEEYQMEKIKNTSKSKEEVEAIKVAWENSGIDFEHRGNLLGRKCGGGSFQSGVCVVASEKSKQPLQQHLVQCRATHIWANRGAGFILLENLLQPRP